MVSMMYRYHPCLTLRPDLGQGFGPGRREPGRKVPTMGDLTVAVPDPSSSSRLTALGAAAALAGAGAPASRRSTHCGRWRMLGGDLFFASVTSSSGNSGFPGRGRMSFFQLAQPGFP